jgi:cyclopropane-fatty-acyl-phospholipid synthase
LTLLTQGFAEAFMLGEVSCPDLVAFFQIFILNKTQLSNGSTIASSVMSTVSGLARSTNTLSNSRLNVSAHYDISNDMFAAFLSNDMTYSCPIWLPQSDPRSVNESLEDAQMRKLRRFIDNAKLKSSDHVLEIGTGWGSFAIEAVRTKGCRVTSLTLSTEQKALAESRIREAGLSDRIEVKLCDYRVYPVPEVLFDKVVSIEMLEAVGREFLDTYFQCVSKLLKPEGGIAVFQCITIPEAVSLSLRLRQRKLTHPQRYESYSKSQDFIQKYIFPGGHLPSVAQLVSSINTGSAGTLVVESIENIGGHYAKTLRLWKEAFNANFENKVKPALLKEHKDMNVDDVEVFRRKWEVSESILLEKTCC